MFTGQDTRWDSFAPAGQKINLLKSLTYRVQQICSKSTLPDELKELKHILMDSGYPEYFVNKVVKTHWMKKQIKQLTANATNYVTIHLPWLGRVSYSFPGILMQLSPKVS